MAAEQNAEQMVRRNPAGVETALTLHDVGPGVPYTTYIPASHDLAKDHQIETGRVIEEGVFMSEPEYDNEDGYRASARKSGRSTLHTIYLQDAGITPYQDGQRWSEAVTVASDGTLWSTKVTVENDGLDD